MPLREPEDRRIRRSWRFFAGSFSLLGFAMIVRLLSGGDGIDLLLVGLLAVVGIAAILHRSAVQALESRRRGEAESVTRLLRGLSRSVSPDAIVGAIAGELASVVEADHVVVVRRRAEPARLDATLVSTRPGIPSSTTQLPMSDLDDPHDDRGGPPRRPPRPVPVAADELGPVPGGSESGGRRLPVAVVAAIGAVRAATTAAATVTPLDRAAPRGSLDPGALEAAAVASPSARSRAVGEAGPGPDPRRAGRIAGRIAERVRGVYALRHTLAAPLVVEREVVGALVLSRRTGGDWPASSQRLLDEAAEEASVALARAYSYRAAEARASTDALTGLPNRRYFDEFCGLLARRRRSGDAVGMLMVDIDHFKRLNDRHGHAVGDEVLRAVAGAIGRTVRDDDVPARYGGEEFAVLLRNPSRSVAAEVGERVRAAVGDLDLQAWGVPGISVSIGVAVQSAPDQPIAELIEQADRALYRAKKAGRDRVVSA